MKTITNAWFKIHICVECKEQLHYEDRCWNKGVCPFCGHESKTLDCDTETLVMRKVYYNEPWWKKLLYMQGEIVKYEGKDEKVKEWIKIKQL